MCGGGGGGLSSIGSALSSAVQGIGGAIDNIIKNPMPVIMTIALTAAVIATAGAAAPGAFALESGFIAAGTASALGGGAVATAVGVGVQQAVIAAAVSALNGGSMSQIGTAALQAGVTAGLTYGVAQNLPEALSSNPLQPDTLAKVASGAIGGAAGAAASAAITGQPIDKAALVGGVAGGTGAYIGDALKGTDFAKDIGTTGVKMLTTAGAAGAGAIAAGKNAGYSATMAAITVGLSTSLSNFQTVQKSVQDTIANSPELQEAAKAVNDAATTLKNTPAEALDQIKDVSKVQQAASNIAEQIQKGLALDTGAQNLTFNNSDVETLRATGQFNDQVKMLDQMAAGQRVDIASGGYFTGAKSGDVSYYQARIMGPLAESLISGASQYVKSIESLSPAIEAYNQAANTLKTNTATLDAGTNNQFSALTDNTQKLIGSVTDYGKYNTQVNTGTLTSTPQQDALDKQILDQNNVIIADANLINQADPNSADYAAAVEKYQQDGLKLVNLSTQSAVLKNYFSGDTTPITGTQVADAIIKAGGAVDVANVTAGYFTDNGMTAPNPVLLDNKGNVILASKDANGNLTDVYSVGLNGSQPPTTEQLQQIASSDNSEAKTFANDANKLLTGQELLTTGNTTANVTPNETNTVLAQKENGTNLLSSVLNAPGNAAQNAGDVLQTVLGITPANAAEQNVPPPARQLVSGEVPNAPGYDVSVGPILPDVDPELSNKGSVGSGTDETIGALNTLNQIQNPNQTQTSVTSPSTGTNLAPTTTNATTGAPGSVGSTNDVSSNATAPKTPVNNQTEATLGALNAVNATPGNSGGTSTTPSILGGLTAGAAVATLGGGNGTGTNGTGAGTGDGTGSGSGGDGTGSGSGGAGSGSGGGAGAGAGAGTGSGGNPSNLNPVTVQKQAENTINPSSSTGLFTPTLVKGTQISSPLANLSIPVVSYGNPAVDPHQLEEIQNAAEGGIMHFAGGGDVISPPGFFKPWTPIQVRGQAIQNRPQLTQMHGVPLSNIPRFQNGGDTISNHPEQMPMEMPPVPGMPENHNPQFFSEGGLNSIKHRYVTGDGDGTSDSIPAMLANGEFVIPADVVSSLGNGSNDSGAKVLDEFLKTIRAHKQKHDAKQLPPDSKGALGYLLEAKHKARI